MDFPFNDWWYDKFYISILRWSGLPVWACINFKSRGGQRRPFLTYRGPINRHICREKTYISDISQTTISPFEDKIFGVPFVVCVFHQFKFFCNICFILQQLICDTCALYSWTLMQMVPRAFNQIVFQRLQYGCMTLEITINLTPFQTDSFGLDLGWRVISTLWSNMAGQAKSVISGLNIWTSCSSNMAQI